MEHRDEIKGYIKAPRYTRSRQRVITRAPTQGTNRRRHREHRGTIIVHMRETTWRTKDDANRNFSNALL